MNDELYNELMQFIEHEEIEDLMKYTGFGEFEILEDFRLYCSLSEKRLSRVIWIEYIEETKEHF